MMMTELSDHDIEELREPADETVGFIRSLEQLCVQNVALLPRIGGNLLLNIAGVGAWTVVTSGPRMGLYAEATDDDVDFAMFCEEWVLHELLDPECEVDLADYAENGVFAAQGDFVIFQRLLQLATAGGNVVNLRAGR